MADKRFTGPIWSLFRAVVGPLFTLHGAFPAIAVVGAGPWSVDAIRRPRQRPQAAEVVEA